MSTQLADIWHSLTERMRMVLTFVSVAVVLVALLVMAALAGPDDPIRRPAIRRAPLRNLIAVPRTLP